MSLLKAVITQVPVGSKSIEGLMAEDNTFGVSFPQLSDYNLVPQKNASRDVKALLGNNFQFLKWRTTLNSKAVNVILLTDFERLLVALAKSGNKSAQDICFDLVGLSLNQLFADAFGQKFEKQERQAWLIDRQSHREDFHPHFTSWLKLDGCDGVQYAIEVNKFKEKLGLPIAPVDTYDAKQLRTLDKAYIKYDTLRTTGMSHAGALLSL